jgi:predicted MFS family arabinose efflux permease
VAVGDAGAGSVTRYERRSTCCPVRGGIDYVLAGRPPYPRPVRDERDETGPDRGGRHRDDPVLGPEDAEDALIDGNRVFGAGTARAALAYSSFRTVYFGSLASNIGTWMQQAILGAYALVLTGSSTFVSIMVFAQLGPLLFSLVGGALADMFDRRKVLMVVALQQMGFSLLLAWLARGDDPSLVGLVIVVFVIGIGQAVHAPTYSALLPVLVRRRDLAGAVSLNSANMNLSRVIGPAIGGVVYARFGADWVFLGNAVTYVFIIVALTRVKLPPVEPVTQGPTGWRRLVEGFGVARRDPVIGRCLLTMTLFSLLCLPFVPHIQRLANDNLGIAPDSGTFGLLYATFGLGAVIGALSIGTFLAGHSLETIVRLGLGGFSVSLAALGLLGNPAPGFPIVLIVGFCYFATVTSLSTVLQQRLDDRVRGRVMAIWVMSFGGTVPIGALIAGPIIDATSITAVVLAGALIAALLVPFADLRDRRRPPETQRSVA